MLIKTCPVSIKAAGTQDGTDDGVFEAIVATYDVDSGGDRITRGAFSETLAEWKASGNPIPVYWSHRMDDPDFNIGHVEAAEETADGLWVRGRLDLDSPKAAQVYRLMKGRRVTQFSFAYDILDGSAATEDGEDFYELRRLKVYEVGPTPIGMNQQTELLGVKHAVNVHVHNTPPQLPDTSDESAGGGQASAKDQGDVVALLKKVLAAMGGTEGDEDKATPTPPAAPEEPPAGAKGDAPARSGTAAFRQHLDAELMLLGVDLTG